MTHGSPDSAGLSRAAVPLAGAIAAYGTTMSFLATTTSLFLADAVRAAPLLVGLFFVVRGIVALGVNTAAGRLSDRLADRRVVLLWAGLTGAAGGACFAELRGYVLVLVTGSVFFGIGGICFAQLFAAAKEVAETRGRPVTAFTSGMRSVFSAAWVIGPPAGLFILTQYGFRALYLAAGGLFLATGLVGRWGLRRTTLPPAASEPAATQPAAGQAARPPRLHLKIWLLIGAILVLGTVNQMYGIDIALFVTRDAHHGAQLVGWMAGACAALEIPVMLLAGRFADRFGRMRVTFGSALLAAVFFCLLPLARSATMLIALQFLNAGWVGLSMSIPMIMVQDEAPGGAGQSSALYTNAITSAQLLAGLITGVAATALGYGNVFWVCAGLSLVAAGLLLARGLRYGPGHRDPWRSRPWGPGPRPGQQSQPPASPDVGFPEHGQRESTLAEP